MKEIKAFGLKNKIANFVHYIFNYKYIVKISLN